MDLFNGRCLFGHVHLLPISSSTFRLLVAIWACSHVWNWSWWIPDQWRIKPQSVFEEFLSGGNSTCQCPCQPPPQISHCWSHDATASLHIQDHTAWMCGSFWSQRFMQPYHIGSDTLVMGIAGLEPMPVACQGQGWHRWHGVLELIHRCSKPFLKQLSWA